MRGKFLQDRIEYTRGLIERYESAIDALVSGGIASYTLDTGQTNQTVTAHNLPGLTRQLESLYNRLSMLEARAGNSGRVYGRPAW